MAYNEETITLDDGSEHEELEILIDDLPGSVRLKLSEKYKVLLNNLLATRKPGNSYHSRMHLLSKEQEAIINILDLLQEELYSPSKEDFRKVTTYSMGMSDAGSTNRMHHVMEVIALTMRLIVYFAKGVPGFDTLTRGDQILLLKGCCVEVLLLRLSRKYDIETNSTYLGNSRPFTRESFRNAYMGDFADFIFTYCRTMYNLQVDNTTYALLTAVSIFSSWPLLLEPTKVEKLRELYTKVLKDYINISQPERSVYYDRLVSTLKEMRCVGKKSIEEWLSLKFYYNKPPPIIEEVLFSGK